MSEEQNSCKEAYNQEQEPPKRRRTPSQFATQIADFKSNYATITKRSRNPRSTDPSMAPQPQTRQSANKPLKCLLPSGKMIGLRVVVGSGKSTRIDKVEKKKSKPANLSPQSPPKPKEEKPKQVSVSFFDKFLSVCEELQKKDDHESPEANQASKENGESRRREQKFRREREEKWVKSYERWKVLSERLDRLVQNFTYLN